MRGILWLGVACLWPVVACNPFSLVDSPSGDVQLLTAARACVDRGDFACAAKYYAQVSSTSSDQVNSEGIFQDLYQNGAPVGTLMLSFLNGAASGGKFITELAGSLTSGAGATRRLAIFHAYQKYALIGDTSLKGLMRFLSASALAAEIFAENATTSGTLKASDIVTNPTTCLANLSNPPAFTGCTAPSTSVLVTGTSIASLLTASDSTMGATHPTLYMIQAAFNEISAGVTQMGASGGGGIGSITQGFTGNVTVDLSNGAIDAAALFQGTLVSYDIGKR